MSQWKPCKRSEFIRRLGSLGFSGLYSGAKHQFMILQRSAPDDSIKQGIFRPQLRMMLREVEAIIDRPLSADEWNRLR